MDQKYNTEYELEEMNITYENADRDDDPASVLRKNFLPVIYSIICICGLTGNLIIIVIFLYYEKLKTLTDVFLLNLSIADMLFLTTLPFLSYQAAHKWIFGDYMCKIVRGVYRINVYTSMLTLTCITFDRFISITLATKANSYQLKKYKWGKSMCVIVWIISVCLAVPQLTCRVHEDCYEVYDPAHIEIIVNSIQLAIGFFAPLTAMVVCYAFIIKTLVTVSSLQKHKSLKIIFTVVVVFIATQLPYNALICTMQLDRYKLMDIHFLQALIISEAISYLHACLNPVLYFFVGIKFRKSLRKILKDLGFANKHKENSDNFRTTDGYSKNISASNNTEGMSMNQL
ncbi:C-X-C chemokine receptor type 6 [Discoglossus pictus]